MKYKKQLLNGIVICSVLSNVLFAASPTKDRRQAVRQGISDLLQTLDKAKFPGKGKQYCAPVAASNSLMWLGSHGYPKLIPQVRGSNVDRQIRMVKILASQEMMNTGPVAGPKSGTSVGQLLGGLQEYVTSCGYKCVMLECQGWRRVPREYAPKISVPEPEWIKSALENKRTIVLWNVGWYQTDKQSGDYKRIGGHWLTATGYRESKESSKRSDVFILHDPAPRAGQSFSRENVFLKRIDSSSLVGEYKGLPRSAEGYFLVEGGMHLKKSADVCILDSVVVMELAVE